MTSVLSSLSIQIIHQQVTRDIPAGDSRLSHCTFITARPLWNHYREMKSIWNFVRIICSIVELFFPLHIYFIDHRDCSYCT